jgi:diguanylate cyclase (GGDEF)-like protein
MDKLRQALIFSMRSSRDGALMFIDLDNFKVLNDTLGHHNGDALLLQVAQRLSLCVRNDDTVARLGGDEFVVMLEQLSGNSQEAADQAEAIAKKIMTALNEPYTLAHHKYHSTPSIGIALFANSSYSTEEVMKRADLAMYQAKTVGRNCLRFFDPKMQSDLTANAAMEAELRHALAQKELLVHYQAQVDKEGRLIGAEALVRWSHPLKGMISPAAFIPLAEQTGLIMPLGIWVLETACTQLAMWDKQLKTANLTLAVNVSARQIRGSDFVAQVMTVLEKTGANPHRLKLEITESLLLDDVEDIITKMETLKTYGVGFSLDDFGTGYSSLSYLKRLPLDQLKIDRSFVRDVFTDSNDAAIASAVVALGQNLGLGVLAEGVETEDQWRFLNEMGCDSYQGYYFGYPMAIKDFEQKANLF